MKTEELLTKWQNELNLSRLELFTLLANTLAEGLLNTHSMELMRTFSKQANRIPFRKLNNVLGTLSKLNFLRF
jgi:hypothetical protein